MRVLISAYSCEPDRGSEPEVGWRTVLAAATRHEVWVITRQNNLPVLSAGLSDHPAQAKITLIGLDLDPNKLKWKKRLGSLGLQWYYDEWQRQAGRLAAELDRDVDFDVVHHVTMSSYWSRVGVLDLGKPTVWGPVGGGVEAPLSLYPVLGIKGALAELARLALRPAMAAWNHARRTARQAVVTLAVNPETASRLGPEAELVPNATAVQLDSVGNGASGARATEIAFVGRLIPLKAATLAIRALVSVRSPATLVIFGDGPDLARVTRLAGRLGVADRVQVIGPIPRSEVLSRIHRASMVIHPAIHEEGSLAVAETLTLGTPLVAIARGGPPVLAPLWPKTPVRLVKPATPKRTAEALAAAIDELWNLKTPLASSPAIPSRSYAADLLSAYDRASTGNRR